MVLGFLSIPILIHLFYKNRKTNRFLSHYISSHTYLLYDKESKVFELIYIFGFLVDFKLTILPFDDFLTCWLVVTTVFTEPFDDLWCGGELSVDVVAEAVWCRVVVVGASL